MENNEFFTAGDNKRVTDSQWYLDQRLVEGREEGRLDGLSTLVKTLKPIFDDLDKVYEAVIRNEAYADVTKEKVMEYYQ